MAYRVLKFARFFRQSFTARCGVLLRFVLVITALFFVSGSANLLPSEPGREVSAEELEEEVTDEILLARGESRTLRRKCAATGSFEPVASERGNLTREAAILPKTGHMLAGGLRAPLRC